MEWLNKVKVVCTFHYHCIAIVIVENIVIGCIDESWVELLNDVMLLTSISYSYNLKMYWLISWVMNGW